jgi:adenine phosphoribosyltransferase
MYSRKIISNRMRIFSDVFGIFANPKIHRALIDVVVNRVKNSNTKVEAVIGLEARGFIFGPQVALELQIPFLPVRKAGKLPGRVEKVEYDLEYGKDTIEMQANILKAGTKVLLVDDLLATGGK